MSETRHASGGLVLRPRAGEWLRAVRERRGDSLARETRAALGLPSDGIVIASGHQAGLWHAGIASKWLAVRAAVARARRAGLAAHGAWFVVDQDVNDAGRVEYPAAGSPPARAAWAFAATEGRATGWVPPARNLVLAPGRAAPALECVREGLERSAAALRDAAGEASLALQTARAAAALLPRGEVDVTIVPVSALARTEAMRRVLAGLSRERVRTYNEATAKFHAAGLRALEIRGTRHELPAWRVSAKGERTPAWSDDAQGDAVLPRALLLTLLMRGYACDLFVHGLGGEIYDPAMEAWVDTWDEPIALAPATVATATLRLPLDTRGIPTPEEMARASWEAHAARHHPAILGGDEAGLDALRARVRSAPRKSAARRAAYRELHEALAQARECHAGAIEAMQARAASLRQQGAGAAVVYDRTWPFPLHPREAMGALRDEVERAFGE